MEKVRKITIEFETHKQTIIDNEANEWFNAMVSMLHGKIPVAIIRPSWKHRKIRATQQSEGEKEPCGCEADEKGIKHTTDAHEGKDKI